MPPGHFTAIGADDLVIANALGSEYKPMMDETMTRKSSSTSVRMTCAHQGSARAEGGKAECNDRPAVSLAPTNRLPRQRLSVLPGGRLTHCTTVNALLRAGTPAGGEARAGGYASRSAPAGPAGGALVRESARRGFVNRARCVSSPTIQSPRDARPGDGAVRMRSQAKCGGCRPNTSRSWVRPYWRRRRGRSHR